MWPVPTLTLHFRDLYILTSEGHVTSVGSHITVMWPYIFLHESHVTFLSGLLLWLFRWRLGEAPSWWDGTTSLWRRIRSWQPRQSWVLLMWTVFLVFCLRRSLHTHLVFASFPCLLPFPFLTLLLSHSFTLFSLSPFSLFSRLLCVYIAIYLPIVFSPCYVIAADNLSTQGTSGF